MKNSIYIVILVLPIIVSCSIKHEKTPDEDWVGRNHLIKHY